MLHSAELIESWVGDIEDLAVSEFAENSFVHGKNLRFLNFGLVPKTFVMQTLRSVFGVRHFGWQLC